jgi:lipopolysaccharide/colanic/teichoic acid biosynthesis glycosyltransferase
MIKRIFDLFFSIIALIVLIIPLFFIWLICTIKLKSNGLFFQTRIGQFGQPFIIFKFKTIHPLDNSISKWSLFLRKSKIDELPQLVNILKGEMSFVGPRPDISGYYDKLQGENLKILELKPGLTSEASIKYANEEYILSKQQNPLQYNDQVIFPVKVKMNLEYYYKRSICLDLYIIIKTIF